MRATSRPSPRSCAPGAWRSVPGPRGSSIASRNTPGSDIEAEQYTLDPEDTARRVTGRSRAIMAVDVFGHPVEWDALSVNAERHGLTLIDDSCEALGAEYRGRRIGGFGAGRGVRVLSEQADDDRRGRGHRDARRAARRAREEPAHQGRAEGSAWLEHLLLGYNYRMDELSAALGISQLKRIEAFLMRRKRVASSLFGVSQGVPKRRRKGARFYS